MNNEGQSWLTRHRQAATAIVTAILTAGVTLGSAYLGADLTRTSADSLQLREIKQQQYTLIAGSVALEIGAISETVDMVDQDDLKGALKSIQEMELADETVRHLFALPLIASSEVADASTAYLDARKTAMATLSEIAQEIERESAPTPDQAERAREAIQMIEIKFTELMLIMREDIGIPL